VTGTGSLSLTTNDGGSNGTLSLGRKGRVGFASTGSALSINGASYQLENTLPALAAAIAANPSGNYALANDYDASQDGTYGQLPVSTTFTGTFEGLGHQIKKMTIKQEHGGGSIPGTGLFSDVDSPGTVRDIGVSDAQITVPSQYILAFAGTLVGTNNGQ